MARIIHIPRRRKLISLGAGEASAQTFSLTPSDLGARLGDIMAVFSCWETDSYPITPPTDWLEEADNAAQDDQGTRRAAIHWTKLSSSQLTVQQWIYGGASGVSFAWCLVRGYSGLIDAVEAVGSQATSIGSDTIDIALSTNRRAAFVAALADGTDQTGETAVMSGVEVEAHSENDHQPGFYGAAGFTRRSGTASYTTTQLTRSQMHHFTAYFA